MSPARFSGPPPRVCAVAQTCLIGKSRRANRPSPTKGQSEMRGGALDPWRPKEHDGTKNKVDSSENDGVGMVAIRAKNIKSIEMRRRD